MPIRKIPKNHLVVTGDFASQKAERAVSFESLLEKEYMMLLDFDPSVLDYEEQPIRIPVVGINQGYVVDLKVRYHGRQTELVEVKTREDLDKHATKFAPKFEAARIYCEQRGMAFVIKTEEDIRTPRLENLKFLRRYRNLVPDPQQRQAVLHAMATHKGESSSERLIELLGAGQRQEWLPVIWHLTLAGDLVANFDEVLPVDVPLRLPDIDV